MDPNQNNVPLMKSDLFPFGVGDGGAIATDFFFLTSVLIKILLLWVWIFKKAKQYQIPTISMSTNNKTLVSSCSYPSLKTKINRKVRKH